MMNTDQTLTSIRQSLTEIRATVERVQNQLAEPIVQQLRPLPIPNSIIWVWSASEDVWVPRVFREMHGERVMCYLNGKCDGPKTSWRHWQIMAAAGESVPTEPPEET